MTTGLEGHKNCRAPDIPGGGLPEPNFIMTSLRDLPSVDQLLQTPQSQEWITCFGRPLTVEAIRSALNDARAHYTQQGSLPEREALLQAVEHYLQSWTVPTLQPVINATGVILQTNLGRAPLSTASLQAIQSISQGYSTLEYDLVQGKRGSRLVHAEGLLTRLTGAQAAMVVNNNAAAVMLILTALARRRAVVIARTQLVEIGGGFRVPDVMKQSGARLLEVGTTNRVHLADYEAALEGTCWAPARPSLQLPYRQLHQQAGWRNRQCRPQTGPAGR
jgi:L-seryl-tRNA(Ser) seleniumtransferase